MPDTARRYTVDQVLTFPDDGNRYELVDGELLVTPSPAQVHQLVLGRLFTSLAGYLAPYHAVAQAFFAPGDIIWSREEYVQPDLFVVPADEVTGDWRDCTTLVLVVEIVSPGSARADRLTKRRLYQRRGVGTYWVVDPNARLAEVWHPDDERPEIVADILQWRVMPEADQWQVDLREVFRDLPGPGSVSPRHRDG